MSESEVARRLAALVRECRRRGMKVTHQRTEVFREVAGTTEHPDAESIYEGTRKRVPAISRDTVYRALAFLEEAGLVRRVDILSDRARFDANTRGHHHFVCRRCGLVRDFESETLDGFGPPPAVRTWGTVEQIQVQLRGVCAACRTTEAPRGRRASRTKRR